MTSPGLLLEAVAELAGITGAAALRHFRADLAVERKRDGSPVTIADRQAEEVAREWLARRFPDDAVLGEEYGARGVGSRRWLVDPIDGTKTFIAGVPLWGTLIAVADGDLVLAGAINCAAAGELVAAAVGEGAWHNGARCSVSRVSTLSEATVLATDERFLEAPARRARWSDLANRAWIARSWGDCYGYLLVATGRAEVMVDPKMNDWDSACLLPIIEEAGGRFTDWRNRRTAFGGDAIATNRSLADQVRQSLCEDPADGP